MMERAPSQLSLQRQARLLAVNRNHLESRPRITEGDRRLMHDLDELHTPLAGRAVESLSSPGFIVRARSAYALTMNNWA